MLPWQQKLVKNIKNYFMHGNYIGATPLVLYITGGMPRDTLPTFFVTGGMGPPRHY
jgi:hypothetical protein